jgi:hypothetical protein
MKAFFTRKVFGKVPVWVVFLVVGGAAFIIMRRKKTPKGNPAAAAGTDPTSPYGFAPPDTYPTEGMAAPASQGTVGLNARDEGLLSKLTAALNANTKALTPIKRPAKKISTHRVGNRPHKNTQRLPSRKKAYKPPVKR